MGFKIESNVPMPTTPCQTRYPFAEMKIGDSILFSSAEGRLARVAAQNWGARNGMRFSSRKVSETSMRIWRIK